MSYTGSGERRCPVHVRPALELLGSAPRCLRRNSLPSMEWRRAGERTHDSWIRPAYPTISSFPLHENANLLDLGHEEAKCEAVVG